MDDIVSNHGIRVGMIEDISTELSMAADSEVCEICGSEFGKEPLLMVCSDYNDCICHLTCFMKRMIDRCGKYLADPESL